jgi:hypothetical protein
MRRKGVFFFFSFFVILLHWGGGMIPDDDEVFRSFLIYDSHVDDGGDLNRFFNAAVLFLIFV